MRLSELEKGAVLSMETRYNNEKLNYELEVVEVFPTSVLVEPIRSEDGKVLNFDSPNLFIDITYSLENEKPVIWKNVNVKCVSYKKQIYHQIVTEREGIPYNRRDSVRIYSGAEGNAQIGPHRVSVPVLVKDVSYSGFAIVSDKEVEDAIGKNVRLVFDDEKLHLDLRALVARMYQLENGKYVYGCHSENASSMLQKYVSVKQRKEIRKNSLE